MKISFSKILALTILYSQIILPKLSIAQDFDIPRPSPKADIKQHIGVTQVEVAYCRPSVKNRQIFGGLIQYNNVWRTGANEATVISFSHDVVIEQKEVKAGKYGLFSIPGKEKWTIILNKEWNQWGAYQYDKEKDVLRIEVNPERSEFMELFTISFSEVNKTKGTLIMQWENIMIRINIEADTYTNTLSEIENVTTELRANWYVYSAAAQYHFYELKNTQEAHRLIDVAIALEAPNPAPWMLKSQIFEYEKKYKEAIEQAELALKVCKTHDYSYEIHENEDQITKWKNLITE